MLELLMRMTVKLALYCKAYFLKNLLCKSLLKNFLESERLLNCMREVACSKLAATFSEYGCQCMIKAL